MSLPLYTIYTYRKIQFENEFRVPNVYIKKISMCLLGDWNVYICEKRDMIFGINLSLGGGVKEVACCGCCTIAVRVIKKYTYASANKSDSIRVGKDWYQESSL